MHKGLKMWKMEIVIVEASSKFLLVLDRYIILCGYTCRVYFQGMINQKCELISKPLQERDMVLLKGLKTIEGAFEICIGGDIGVPQMEWLCVV